MDETVWSFKPYYNWNAFNTLKAFERMTTYFPEVLNLIITGIASIPMILD
ncbi:hypothetical protein [Fusobacterium pseudoperiodonticum]|nr:hypothetical protein [Fusobacterium pseudoperiodonticum]